MATNNQLMKLPLTGQMCLNELDADVQPFDEFQEMNTTVVGGGLKRIRETGIPTISSERRFFSLLKKKQGEKGALFVGENDKIGSVDLPIHPDSAWTSITPETRAASFFYYDLDFEDEITCISDGGNFVGTAAGVVYEVVRVPRGEDDPPKFIKKRYHTYMGGEKPFAICELSYQEGGEAFVAVFTAKRIYSVRWSSPTSMGLSSYEEYATAFKPDKNYFPILAPEKINNGYLVFLVRRGQWLMGDGTQWRFFKYFVPDEIDANRRPVAPFYVTGEGMLSTSIFWGGHGWLYVPTSNYFYGQTYEPEKPTPLILLIDTVAPTVDRTTKRIDFHPTFLSADFGSFTDYEIARHNCPVCFDCNEYTGCAEILTRAIFTSNNGLTSTNPYSTGTVVYFSKDYYICNPGIEILVEGGTNTERPVECGLVRIPWASQLNESAFAFVKGFPVGFYLPALDSIRVRNRDFANGGWAAAVLRQSPTVLTCFFPEEYQRNTASIFDDRITPGFALGGTAPRVIDFVDFVAHKTVGDLWDFSSTPSVYGAWNAKLKKVPMTEMSQWGGGRTVFLLENFAATGEEFGKQVKGGYYLITSASNPWWSKDRPIIGYQPNPDLVCGWMPTDKTKPGFFNYYGGTPGQSVFSSILSKDENVAVKVGEFSSGWTFVLNAGENIGQPFPLSQGVTLPLSPYLWGNVRSGFNGEKFLFYAGEVKKLMMQGTTPLPIYSMTAGLEGIDDVMFLQGQPYAISNEAIYSFSIFGQQLTNLSPIVDVSGMKYCANNGIFSLFFSEQNRCFYLFDGSNQLRFFKEATAIKSIIDSDFNSATNDILILPEWEAGADDRLLVVKQDASVYAVQPEVHEHFTEIVKTDWAFGAKGSGYVLFSFFEEFFENKAIRFKSSFWGPDPTHLYRYDTFYFWLFKDDFEFGAAGDRKGFFKVKIETLTDINRQTSERTFEVGQSDFSDNGQCLIRFAPQFQTAVAFSLSVESDFMIYSAQVSFADLGVNAISRPGLNG